jgi:hypothetical protein
MLTIARPLQHRPAQARDLLHRADFRAATPAERFLAIVVRSLAEAYLGDRAAAARSMSKAASRRSPIREMARRFRHRSVRPRWASSPPSWTWSTSWGRSIGGRSARSCAAAPVSTSRADTCNTPSIRTL